MGKSGISLGLMLVCLQAKVASLMPGSFGESSTEYMPVGVRKHIPAICVEVSDLDYTAFAFQTYLPEVASLLLASTLMLRGVWLA